MPVHMTKVPEYPLPHEFGYSYALTTDGAESGTIMPILAYDEGLGVINSAKTNPQNASFVEVATHSCYPTSKIHQVFAELRVNLSKEAIETDKVRNFRFATMKIHTSFMDGQLAEDEVSGLDLNEILELQNEQTDRQTYPLYNGTKLKTYKDNASLDMPATQLGLTTDLEIEDVSFLHDDYYDCLHYYTNGKKLTSIQDGLHWHTLSRDHPSKTMRFYQNEATKFMNPYAFLGVQIYCPNIGDRRQYGKPGDTTDIGHLECSFTVRFNEWNHEFNHALQ